MAGLLLLVVEALRLVAVAILVAPGVLAEVLSVRQVPA